MIRPKDAGICEEHILKALESEGGAEVGMTMRVSAPKDAVAFGLSFVIRSERTGFIYSGDGQYFLLLVLPPGGKVFTN